MRIKVGVVKAFRLFHLVPMPPGQVWCFYRRGMDLLSIVLRLTFIVQTLNLTENRQTRFALECYPIKFQPFKIFLSLVFFFLHSAVWPSFLFCRELYSRNFSMSQMYNSMGKTCHFVQSEFFPPDHTGQHLHLLV